MVLGHRFLGLMGEIKIDVLEIGPELFAKVFPWAVPGPSGLSLTPPLNVDLYDYARLLVLHPTDRPGDNTEDLWLAKAAAASRMDVTKSGQKDDMWQIGFQIYPDRDFLFAEPPEVVYGGIGTPPG